MSEPLNPEETWESYFGRRRRLSVLRPLKHEFALGRKHAEKIVNHLHRTIEAKMRIMDRRVMTELEEIDASLNLIARELSRRGDGRRPEGHD